MIKFSSSSMFMFMIYILLLLIIPIITTNAPANAASSSGIPPHEMETEVIDLDKPSLSSSSPSSSSSSSSSSSPSSISDSLNTASSSSVSPNHDLNHDSHHERHITLRSLLPLRFKTLIPRLFPHETPIFHSDVYDVMSMFGREIDFLNKKIDKNTENVNQQFQQLQQLQQKAESLLNEAVSTSNVISAREAGNTNSLNKLQSTQNKIEKTLDKTQSMIFDSSTLPTRLQNLLADFEKIDNMTPYSTVHQLKNAREFQQANMEHQIQDLLELNLLLIDEVRDLKGGIGRRIAHPLHFDSTPVDGTKSWFHQIGNTIWKYVEAPLRWLVDGLQWGYDYIMHAIYFVKFEMHKANLFLSKYINTERIYDIALLLLAGSVVVSAILATLYTIYKLLTSLIHTLGLTTHTLSDTSHYVREEVEQLAQQIEHGASDLYHSIPDKMRVAKERVSDEGKHVLENVQHAADKYLPMKHKVEHEGEEEKKQQPLPKRRTTKHTPFSSSTSSSPSSSSSKSLESKGGLARFRNVVNVAMSKLKNVYSGTKATIENNAHNIMEKGEEIVDQGRHVVDEVVDKVRNKGEELVEDVADAAETGHLPQHFDSSSSKSVDDVENVSPAPHHQRHDGEELLGSQSISSSSSTPSDTSSSSSLSSSSSSSTSPSSLEKVKSSAAQASRELKQAKDKVISQGSKRVGDDNNDNDDTNIISKTKDSMKYVREVGGVAMEKAKQVTKLAKDNMKEVGEVAIEKAKEVKDVAKEKVEESENKPTSVSTKTDATASTSSSSSSLSSDQPSSSASTTDVNDQPSSSSSLSSSSSPSALKETKIPTLSKSTTVPPPQIAAQKQYQFHQHQGMPRAS